MSLISTKGKWRHSQAKFVFGPGADVTRAGGELA
jgi:hypothetical protein